MQLRLAGLWCLLLCAGGGCATQQQIATSRSVATRAVAGVPEDHAPVGDVQVGDVQVEAEAIHQVSHVQGTSEAIATNDVGSPDPALPTGHRTSSDTLSQLEQAAISGNPGLRRLEQEYQAAKARVCYIGRLPDPTVGANIFASPIETAAGSQRANVSLTQMLPSLARLNAQEQQACFESLALQQIWAAERLKVIGELRARWYRLYVLQKQIDTTVANQELLTSLTDVANSRVAVGRASQGDVLIGTLEYSRLEEQLVTLQQQVVSTKADINRLIGRAAETEVPQPGELDVRLPDWTHGMLKQLAVERQPEIAAARIRVQAARWGLEVARLKRRPDVSLNTTWFAIDDNRPTSMIVDVGQDAWSVGAMVNIPLWQDKNDAMEFEAGWKHSAAASSVDAVIQRYDAALRDLWEQARAADETARLYQMTILPQARQTLAADQGAYSNGDVEFDRIVNDFRNVLTLELGYHRALGQLATAVARIRQATGT